MQDSGVLLFFIRYIPGFDERWYVLCIIPPREITVRATISVKQDKNKQTLE